MNDEPIDSRAEFLEWAQLRARRILDFQHGGLVPVWADPLKAEENAALRHSLELAICEALLEVFDRMAEGE